jgi:3-deoxy-D-manno-octulosonic-acid transferase
MYLTYSILYLIALLFLFPFEYLKRPKELRRRWLKERSGFFDAQLLTLDSQRIWIHAVSVGEVIAAVPLIKKIKERHPAAEVIVSTVTDTGQKVARERIGNIARIVYVPFDLPFAVNSALKKIKPSLFIIMETELWPNAIRILSRSGVPVLLMNGRISEKSFGGYKKLRFFIKDVLKNVSIFCMQNELYAERIKKLGAEPDKIKTIGNFKFDTRPSSTLPKWTKLISSQLSVDRSRTDKREFTIIAGSTHRTEEELIIDAYIKLKQDFPHLNLIVAPRHPERFREVEDLTKKKDLEYIKRSELANSDLAHSSWLMDANKSYELNEPSVMSYQLSGVIILLDVIGELSSVYSACDVAIMGGSFIEHGGQNPLEPAYWGKAIVCGPHMENFPFIDDFYRGGGALKADSDNLYESLKSLLISSEKISFMGKAAKELYEKNSGATDRAMEIIDLMIRRQKIEDRKQTIEPKISSLLERLYYIGYSLDKRYKLKHQKRLPHKVISIGNITVGGTGKTPATIAIAEEAKRRGFSPIILTRGYKGKAKEPCFVKGGDELSVMRNELKNKVNASRITHHASRLYGDEPVLMAERLKDVPIVKYSDRYEGGMFALQHLSANSPILFILDDGFQHRRLYRDMDIVLIDGLSPFGNRRMLPMGPMREPLNELKRADIFVVTKAKNNALLDELRDINPEAPVYFSEHRIHRVRDMDGNEYPIEMLKDKKVYAFCGIANPDSFRQTVLSVAGEVRGFRPYKDHYKYIKADIDYLKKQCKDLTCDFLITTEKDMVKLKELNAPANLLCIEIGFYVDEEFYDAIF